MAYMTTERTRHGALTVDIWALPKSSQAQRKTSVDLNAFLVDNEAYGAAQHKGARIAGVPLGRVVTVHQERISYERETGTRTVVILS